MEEAHGASWWSLRGLLRLFALYVIVGFGISYVVALLRATVYRKHFKGAHAGEWLKYI